MRSGSGARSRSSLLPRVAVVLYAASLLSPRTRIPLEVEVDVGLSTLQELRGAATTVAGVTLTMRTTSRGGSLDIEATVRNDSSACIWVRWPETCHGGMRIYRSGETAVVYRASLPPFVVHDFHDWDTLTMFVLLEPGDQLVERLGLPSSSSACTTETPSASAGPQAAALPKIINVLVAYEVTPFHEPEWLNDVDSDRRRFHWPTSTPPGLIVAEALVPPVVRVVHRDGDAVERGWSITRATPYR